MISSSSTTTTTTTIIIIIYFDFTISKPRVACYNFCLSTINQIELVSGAGIDWATSKRHLELICVCTHVSVFACVFYVTLGSSRRLQGVMRHSVVAVGNPLKAVQPQAVS